MSNDRGTGCRLRRAFSLMELVIVIVLIGIIAAIAAPRFGGASESAATASFQDTLQNIRTAISLYRMDHKKYPTLQTKPQQLTCPTDINGNFKADCSSDTTHKFGPYLDSEKAFPEAMAGGCAGQIGVLQFTGTCTPTQNDQGVYGWLYNPECNMQIWLNDAAYFGY